jgi:hypothetical protein
MTRITIVIAAALALAVTLPFAPAQATGVPRTFVSAAGSDLNNCTNVATPCRHMAAAYAATAADGEIYVLDPANYGSLTITGPVSIEGHGWASIAPTSGNAAITINANTGDKINIIGVVLDGTALTNTNGIQFNSGGSLTVVDSVVRNFGNCGIIVEPSAGIISFQISNSFVLDNANAGIYLTPRPNARVTGTIDRVTADGNNYGIYIDSTAAFSLATASITSSNISNNLNTGITAIGTSFTSATAYVKESTLSNNPTGISVSGSQGYIFLSHSMIAGSTVAGINFADSGSSVNSAGNNDISNNPGPVIGGSLGTLPQQ